MSMENPFKRPRLSVFKNISPDAELEHARRLNDLSLKSRFESIFKKYSQDFTQIGDEIDILSGDITVNNGHLESMVSETDAGKTNSPCQRRPPPQASPRTAPPRATTLPNRPSGKSLLRAMTALPEVEHTYLDNPVSNVIMESIETIAEEAAAYSGESTDKELDEESGEETSGDSEEGSDECTLDTPSFQQTSTSHRPVRLPHPSIRQSIPRLEDGSDEDSLFGANDELRSTSPDSLFEGEDKVGTMTFFNGDNQVSRWQSADSGIQVDVNGKENLDKFKSGIVNDILKLLEKRKSPQDSHLEPAWRIPVEINPLLPARIEASPSDLPLSIKREASPNNAFSLWTEKQPKPPKRRKKRKPVVAKVRGRSLLRAESEDPLQVGFCPKQKRKGTAARVVPVHVDSSDDDNEGVKPLRSGKVAAQAVPVMDYSSDDDNEDAQANAVARIGDVEVEELDSDNSSTIVVRRSKSAKCVEEGKPKRVPMSKDARRRRSARTSALQRVDPETTTFGVGIKYN